MTTTGWSRAGTSTTPAGSVRNRTLAFMTLSLSQNDQKTALHAARQDPIPHHPGAPFGFRMGELDQLPRTERSALVRHAKAARADVHQSSIDFQRLRIGE